MPDKEQIKKAIARRDARAAGGGKRRVRDIVNELADALDPDENRESVHIVEGKQRTVMDVVDEAVRGAKPDPQ